MKLLLLHIVYAFIFAGLLLFSNLSKPIELLVTFALLFEVGGITWRWLKL